MVTYIDDYLSQNIALLSDDDIEKLVNRLRDVKVLDYEGDASLDSRCSLYFPLISDLSGNKKFSQRIHNMVNSEKCSSGYSLKLRSSLLQYSTETFMKNIVLKPFGRGLAKQLMDANDVLQAVANEMNAFASHRGIDYSNFVEDLTASEIKYMFNKLCENKTKFGHSYGERDHT